MAKASRSGKNKQKEDLPADSVQPDEKEQTSADHASDPVGNNAPETTLTEEASDEVSPEVLTPGDVRSTTDEEATLSQSDTVSPATETEMADDSTAAIEEADTVTSDPDQDNPWVSSLEDGVSEASDETAEQENRALPPAPVPVVREVNRGSIWPAVLGGVVAAVFGFIAGRGDQFDAWLPDSMQRGTVDLSALESQTGSLEMENAALAGRVDVLESANDDELIAALTDVETSVDVLAQRLNELENRPVIIPDTADETAAAIATAVAGLQSALAEQSAEIDALKIQADAARQAARSEASRILARAALTRVVTAVDNGETFQPALGDLEEAAPVDVPVALRDAAAEGVPTLAALRESFPDSARAGLSAARSDLPETEVESIGGFLRRQLSARSVTPREGDDPDAVLSRAEAALKQGNLGLALSEMEVLPQSAQDAMQDWLASARARQAARDAANALSDSLQSN